MSTTNIDEGKLNAFIGQMLSDLGGASSIAMVRLGDTLGLYKAIHANGADDVDGTCQGRKGRRALSARMAIASGSFELSVLRSRDRQIRDATRAGHGVRQRGEPCLHDGRLRSHGGNARQSAQGAGGIQIRRRRCLGRPGRLHVLRGRAFLPAGLPQQPRLILAARARRGREEARGRRTRCRRRLRTRLVYRPDGQGVPEIAVLGYDFHPELDPRRCGARQRAMASRRTRNSPWA